MTTNVSLSPLLVEQQFSNAGTPLAGGLIHTYLAGTTTPASTWTDSAGTILQSNPIVLDSTGRPGEIWLDNTLAYKLVLSDSLDNPITTFDNITAGHLTSVLSSSTGSANVGFIAAGGVATTVQAALREAVSVQYYGAVGDGTTDDSAAFQAALNASPAVDAKNKNYKINTTISIPAGRTLDLRGATITANTGATPLFSFTSGNAGLYILGGTIIGTASCMLFAQGTTDTPTAQSMYASQIRIEGTSISSATITTALSFDKAVKSVNLHGVNFFTPNGINASGKCVEVMISDSIIYSATGASGTRGIKLRSTGGTTYYNEGWSIVNSTVDNFEITHDIADVFVYQLVGGYHGANAALGATTGYCLQILPPVGSSLTEDICIGGGIVIAGRTRFGSSGAGQAYNAVMDAVWVSVPGTAVSLENNASNITVKGFLKAGTGSAIAVVGTNNNSGIETDIKVDSTYTNGVVLNGASGTNCEVSASGPSSGDIIGAARSNIRYNNIPVHSSGVASLKQAFSSSNLGGGATYAVGVAISTQLVGFAKGETGHIVIHLAYSGATAATQNLQITTPAGMVLPSGTGWSAGNIYLGAANGLVSVRVPYYCTADGADNVIVTNQAGSTLTVINQGYCGIERDF